MECYNPEFFEGMETVDLCITLGQIAMRLEMWGDPIDKMNLEWYEAELDRRIAESEHGA